MLYENNIRGEVQRIRVCDLIIQNRFKNKSRSKLTKMRRIAVLSEANANAYKNCDTGNYVRHLIYHYSHARFLCSWCIWLLVAS